MNKLKNLSKFLGVVIGLLLGQALYAQKVVSPRVPSTTPPVTYVTGSTALSRIDTKITQYLGQWKQNVAGAQINHQFYTYLRTYVSEGVNGTTAIAAAARKMYESGLVTDSNKTWATNIYTEATTLLQQ